jgi:hypothetical protein
VLHLAKAATLGNIRATNYLAHALWDTESWLGSYYREKRYAAKNGKDTEQSDENIGVQSSLRWIYNHSEPIEILLPDMVITLPCPLGPSQETALLLFKHLATKSSRANDMADAALEAYITGDYLMSLDYFDEAAVMIIKYDTNLESF